jgi:L-threonylcarbamoyladenylate synthase
LPLVVHRSTVSEVVGSVLRGGIVLAPTDTVYGLAVHPEVKPAVDRLFELKGRPPQKNLPVMISDPGRIESLGVLVNEPARRLLSSGLVPGPLTLVFGFNPGAERPAWLAGRAEVAIRIPDHDLLREILRQTGPLLVTSANASGKPTPRSVGEVLDSLLDPPDYVIDGGMLSATPSTLVNCRVSPPQVERVGEVPVQKVEEILHG